MKIDHDAAMLRRALAHYPTGVTVVTACGDNGQLLGITANSFTSVSLEPPLVSWSLRKRSQLFEKFRSSERFAVNVLAATQADLADRFAQHAEDRFAGLQFCRGLGGVALLAGCVAYFECVTAACHAAGDHGILIGQVERFSAGESQELPLLFCKGSYMKPTDRAIAA